MPRAMFFLLFFLIDVKITLANAPVATKPVPVKLEKQSTAIQIEPVKREPRRKKQKQERRKAVFQIDSDTRQDKEEKAMNERRRTQKNINEDVDSDFFAGSQELSSRQPNSVVEEQLPKSLKERFLENVKAHWISLKKYFFGL